jgi:hypothetical protein
VQTRPLQHCGIKSEADRRVQGCRYGVESGLLAQILRALSETDGQYPGDIRQSLSGQPHEELSALLLTGCSYIRCVNGFFRLHKCCAIAQVNFPLRDARQSSSDQSWQAERSDLLQCTFLQQVVLQVVQFSCKDCYYPVLIQRPIHKYWKPFEGSQFF